MATTPQFISTTMAGDIADTFAESMAMLADDDGFAPMSDAVAQCVRGIAEALAQHTMSGCTDYDKGIALADRYEASMLRLMGPVAQ